MIYKALLNTIYRGSVGNKLSILIFHRVLKERDDLFPSTIIENEFDCLLSIIKNNFNVLQLSDAVGMLKSQTLPLRALSITFDDGYMDNHSVALPLLNKHGLNATFFIATGYLDGSAMWNDILIESIRDTSCKDLNIKITNNDTASFQLHTNDMKRNAINTLIPKLKHLSQDDRSKRVLDIVEKLDVDVRKNLMMTPVEIKSLDMHGMGIGAHTVTHPILAKVQSNIAKDEIYASKVRLEEIINKEITVFAYPNGQPNKDYLAEHVAICKDLGMSAAVSTVWGAANSDSDLYQLPRFTPWNRTKSKFMLQMMQNLVRRNSLASYV